jgi:plastocyanin
MRRPLSLVALLLATATAGSGLSDNHLIETSGMTFTPSDLTIAVGDSVTWSNPGSGFHNVAAKDDSFRCAVSCDGAGGDPSDTPWMFTLIFRTQAEVDYFCEVHGLSMSGVVHVEGIFGDGFESGNTEFWTPTP